MDVNHADAFVLLNYASHDDGLRRGERINEAESKQSIASNETKIRIRKYTRYESPRITPGRIIIVGKTIIQRTTGSQRDKSLTVHRCWSFFVVKLDEVGFNRLLRAFQPSNRRLSAFGEGGEICRKRERIKWKRGYPVGIPICRVYFRAWKKGTSLRLRGMEQHYRIGGWIRKEKTRQDIGCLNGGVVRSIIVSFILLCNLFFSSFFLFFLETLQE